MKNKGVLGLEYYEDDYSTQPKDHEGHLVMFPSMQPVSRYEVIQLKKTLNDMLTHAGLNDEDVQLEGPTQVTVHFTRSIFTSVHCASVRCHDELFFADAQRSGSRAQRAGHLQHCVPRAYSTGARFKHFCKQVGSYNTVNISWSQVSIECRERGELLSEIRSRYAQLINRIPRQIKA